MKCVKTMGLLVVLASAGACGPTAEPAGDKGAAAAPAATPGAATAAATPMSAEATAAATACRVARRRIGAIESIRGADRLLQADELTVCRRAADAGDKAATYALALHFLGAGDPAQARIWLERGVEQGHAAAYIALGKAELKTNPERARDLFKRAALSGTPFYRQGLQMLAFMAKTDGDGRKQLKWQYVIADSGGSYLPEDFARLQATLPAADVSQARTAASAWIAQSGYGERGWPELPAAPAAK